MALRKAWWLNIAFEKDIAKKSMNYELIPLSFLQFQVVCLLVISIALYFLYSNITWLWILYIGVSLFCGSLISTGPAMLNRYIDFTAMSQISSHFGSAFGDVGVMFALSWSYQNFGPYVIWPYLVGITTVMMVVTCTMQVIAWHMGDRFQKKERIYSEMISTDVSGDEKSVHIP